MVAMYSPIVIRAADAFAKGGLVDTARSVASAGRNGDSVLLHVNPEEMEWLRAAWGEPTTNPDTGLPEYFKMRDVIRKVLPFATAALPVLFPGVGAAIGSTILPSASPLVAGALGNAVVGGASGLISGGGGEGAARGALTSGVLSAITGLAGDRMNGSKETSPAPEASEKPSWLRRNALPVGAGVLGALALGGSRSASTPTYSAPALPSSFTEPLPVLESDRELESNEDYDNIDWTTYGERAPRSFFRNNYLPRDDDEMPTTGFADGGSVSFDAPDFSGYDTSSIDASGGVEGGLAGTGYDAGATADSPSIAPQAVDFSVPVGMAVPATQATSPGRGGILGYIQEAMRDAARNPVRTGVDVLTAMSPLAIPNAIAKGLTGNSVGSLVTSLGRGVGDAIGLNEDPDAKAAEMGYTGPTGWADAMPTNYGYAPTNEVGIADSVSYDSTQDNGPQKQGEYAQGDGSGSLQPVGALQNAPLSYISRTTRFGDPASYFTYGEGPQKSFYAHGGAAEGDGELSQDPRYFERGSGSGRIDNIPAVLSPKEYVMDAETVALLGDGNPDEGAKKLDEMRSQLRKHKGKALSRGNFSPNARSPLSYIGRS